MSVCSEAPTYLCRGQGDNHAGVANRYDIRGDMSTASTWHFQLY